jgi:hypothetical protein
MYELDGYKITKDRGFYIFKFEDYDCTVEFVRSHFLVKEGKRQPGLSIDQIDKLANRWKKADILVFNTGHWWTHGKTNRGMNYYKVGDYIYPHLGTAEALRIAIKTWSEWIDKNIDPAKLVFYRGYSTTHFRGGEWDSGSPPPVQHSRGNGVGDTHLPPNASPPALFQGAGAFVAPTPPQAVTPDPPSEAGRSASGPRSGVTAERRAPTMVR